MIYLKYNFKIHIDKVIAHTSVIKETFLSSHMLGWEFIWIATVWLCIYPGIATVWLFNYTGISTEMGMGKIFVQVLNLLYI